MYSNEELIQTSHFLLERERKRERKAIKRKGKKGGGKERRGKQKKEKERKPLRRLRRTFILACIPIYYLLCEQSEF